MLCKSEEIVLVDQLRFVFDQFVESDQEFLVDAVLRLSVDSFLAILKIRESILDCGDKASCGPSPPAVGPEAGSEVRCPHCNRNL